MEEKGVLDLSNALWSDAEFKEEIAALKSFVLFLLSNSTVNIKAYELGRCLTFLKELEEHEFKDDRCQPKE